MQNSYPVFTSMGRQALLAIAFESLFWQWASRVWMSLQVTGTGSAGASRTAFQTYKRTRHDPTARKVVQLTKWGGRGGGGVIHQGTRSDMKTWSGARRSLATFETFKRCKTDAFPRLKFVRRQDTPHTRGRWIPKKKKEKRHQMDAKNGTHASWL